MWISNNILQTTYDEESEHIIHTIQDTDGVILTFEERFYINFIISNLKELGLWSKIKAAWFFVGGTAATHKWNMKDMRNLDAAFRLTFPNGMTHSANGITGNGSTQYANTHFIPSNNLVVGDNSITYYCNTLPATEKETNYVLGAGLFGQVAPDNKVFNIIMRRNGIYVFSSSNSSVNTAVVYSNNGTSTIGCFTGNIKSGVISLNRNGKPITNSSTFQGNGTTALPTSKVYLLTTNDRDGFSPNSEYFDTKTLAYVDFSDGLTNEEMIIKSHIITTAQGILGRK